MACIGYEKYEEKLKEKINIKGEDWEELVKEVRCSTLDKCLPQVPCFYPCCAIFRHGLLTALEKKGVLQLTDTHV